MIFVAELRNHAEKKFASSVPKSKAEALASATAIGREYASKSKTATVNCQDAATTKAVSDDADDLKTLADQNAFAEMKAAADLKAKTKKDSKKAKVKADDSKKLRVVRKTKPIFKEDFMRIEVIRLTSFIYAKIDGRSEESVHQARRDFCAATGYNYDSIQAWGEEEVNSYYNCEELLDEALIEALRVKSDNLPAEASFISEVSITGDSNAESRSIAVLTTLDSRGSDANHHSDGYNSSSDVSIEEEDCPTRPQVSTSAEDRVRVIPPSQPKKPPDSYPGEPAEIKFKSPSTKKTNAASRLSYEKKQEAKDIVHSNEQLARQMARESFEYASRSKVWEGNMRAKIRDKVSVFDEKMRVIFNAASEKKTAFELEKKLMKDSRMEVARAAGIAMYNSGTPVCSSEVSNVKSSVLQELIMDPFLLNVLNIHETG